MKCRNCKSLELESVIDLGTAPASNAYLKKEHLNMSEGYTPLEVVICKHCKLVQTKDFFQPDELFTPDYAYLSSASESWLKHCEDFCASISKELNLSERSLICEVASNDGYLLKNFVASGYKCFGIEPTSAAAEIAVSKGVDTIVEFLGRETATEISRIRGKCDLIIGNNVYAHVPDIRDFTDGLAILLAETGSITLEFPHVLSLLAHNQFDTIYHEHFSYHSLLTCKDILERSNLEVYHAEKISTHGGSLRIFVQHHEGPHKKSDSLGEILKEELDAGLSDIQTYKNLQNKALKIREELRSTICAIKAVGGEVIAYGAAAKGNTLLNYSGINSNDIKYVFDKSILKVGKYLPGSRIPIIDAEKIKEVEFTHIFILPWNIKSEIIEQLKKMGVENKKIITAIPNIEILDI